MYKIRNALFFMGLCGLVIVVLLASCNGTSVPQIPISPGDREYSDFDFLELGMKYDEIIKIVGDADRDIGSGVHLFVYDLADGKQIILSFISLDDLQAVYHYDPERDTREVILGSEK